jgi:hypothetical protein
VTSGERAYFWIPGPVITVLAILHCDQTLCDDESHRAVQQLNSISAQHNSDQVRVLAVIPSEKPTGVTRYDPSLACNTYVLFSASNDHTYLIDRNANVVNTLGSMQTFRFSIRHPLAALLSMHRQCGHDQKDLQAQDIQRSYCWDFSLLLKDSVSA